MELSTTPSIKIGLVNPSSQVFTTKKIGLNILDFNHYKIGSIKFFSLSYITSIEIHYHLLSETSDQIDNFFVDLFQASPKVSKDAKDSKITTYSFGPDEEVIEISGRSGLYLDQLILKTNRGKCITAGNDGGSEFSHKAPIGYCFNLFRVCTLKEYIESLEIDIQLSSVYRFKIYKIIEEKSKDSLFNDYHLMEKKIDVHEKIIRERYDFEKEEDELFSYKMMRKELNDIVEIDKLGFMRYYLKYLYLDRKNSSELSNFTEELLKALKDIYKLLKYPRLLFDEKLEPYAHNEIKPISKTHPAFKTIFQLLVIVQCLLESPAPFASSFAYLKTLLLNIHDLYVSFLITLINLTKIKTQEPEKNSEKIKNLLRPAINLYGHHLGFYVVSENLFKSFMDSSQTFFKINQLSFRRINSQDIFYYERQMLVHCFNRKMFNSASVPSTIIGVRQFKTNNLEKANESFFILSFEPNSLMDIKFLENLSYEEMSSINENSFANQLIASIFCSPLESLSASFVFEKKNKELIRIPSWNDLSKELKSSIQEDSSLRNPLYVIDVPMLLKPINKQFLQKLRDLPLEQLFVEFLAWVKLETFLISFEYYTNSSNESKEIKHASEIKKHEKIPIFCLAEETVRFLYRCAVYNLAFIKDNSHLKLIDILFHLNPIVSLCQEQLLKYFPDHQTRLKQIKYFDFDVIFARSKMEIKKLCRPKIRKYTEKMKKFNNTKGKSPIHKTVTKWLKNFPLNKMENSKIECFLQHMLLYLPLSTNQEIYTHWNSFMNWESLIPYLFKNSIILDFLIDLSINIKAFKFHNDSQITNLFDLLTNETQINDPLILDVYIKKGGFNADEGYPFTLTPFERAISKESHFLVKKMLSLGAGKKANPDNLQGYILKFYENDDYEVLSSNEGIKENIKSNIENLLEIYPVLKWRLIWELLKKKPANETINGYLCFFSCDNEEIFVLKEKIEKIYLTTSPDFMVFILQ